MAISGARAQTLGDSAHRKTIALVGKIARQEHINTDADEQCAVLTGVMAGVAELLWLGRSDGMGVPELLDVWNKMGKDLLGQAALIHLKN